jgi:hypothetical protein
LPGRRRAERGRGVEATRRLAVGARTARRSAEGLLGRLAVAAAGRRKPAARGSAGRRAEPGRWWCAEASGSGRRSAVVSRRGSAVALSGRRCAGRRGRGSIGAAALPVRIEATCLVGDHRSAERIDGASRETLRSRGWGRGAEPGGRRLRSWNRCRWRHLRAERWRRDAEHRPFELGTRSGRHSGTGRLSGRHLRTGRGTRRGGRSSKSRTGAARTRRLRVHHEHRALELRGSRALQIEPALLAGRRRIVVLSATVRAKQAAPRWEYRSLAGPYPRALPADPQARSFCIGSGPLPSPRG